MHIPFKSEIVDRISKVIYSGNWSSLHGKEVEKFEKKIAEIVGVRYAIAVNSGTSALHLALKSMLTYKNDEIIVSNLTFMATASAIEMCGAKPVLVDTIKNGYTIDPDEIRKKITDDTKGIISVHLCGIPSQMDEINEIAMENNLFVIEDACQAFGSTFMGTPVGALGDVGCFSFYPSKVIPIGEGGMLVTNSAAVYEIATRLRNHGRKYQEGNIGFIGYNYRMPEISAAIGNVIVKHWKEIKTHYNEKHEVSRWKYWTPKRPSVPPGSEIISTYIPFIHGVDLKTKKFYRPLNTLIPFYTCGDFSNSDFMYRRTEKIWLD